MMCSVSHLLFFTVLLIVTSPVWSQEIWRPRQLGTFNQQYAAYVGLIPTENTDVDPRDMYTLYVSTFNPQAAGEVDATYYMRSPGRNLDNVADWQLTQFDKSQFWPNDLMQMQSSVVGSEGIIWTAGFHVPTKNKGSLNIYLTAADPVIGPYNIASLDDEEYSYHRVEWYDVNHDGFIDAVSARYHKAGPETNKSLVWFENPGLGEPSEGWTQNLIYEGGPDVNFKIATIPVADKEFIVVVGAEFWNQQIVLYYAEDGSDSFLSDPSKIIQLKIDVSVGLTFDVDVMDLNLDGRPEFILSAFNATEGNVIAYPVPYDFRTDGFERKIIADAFIPHVGQGYMSPGAVKSYYRDRAHEESGNKPYVLVSGDDNGCHYILSPDSEDVNNWSYTKNLLIDTNGTTSGKFAIADLNNDGFNEIVAAGYNVGEIYVFTYAP